MTTPGPELILASSSPFRRALLARLQLPFQCQSPDIDEGRRPGETPGELVARLGREKAAAVVPDCPHHRILAGDQVAVAPDGEVLGKPGSRDKAVNQLLRLQGRRLSLPTSLCLYNSATGEQQETVETFAVEFRSLDRTVIERYVDQEQPLDSAGAFYAEGLGITLFRSLEGRDPNTLIGLPLIALTEMLAADGLALP